MPKHNKAKQSKQHGQPFPRRPRDNTIPGTNTKDNEILQARRYLGHLRNPATSSPFSIEAIRELERVFHKKPEVRAANLANNMSNAGKELLRAFESERDNARALGSSADWWSDGLEKKGISTADQQAFAAARRALNAGGVGITAMMGVSELGMEELTFDEMADTTEADLGGNEAGPVAEAIEEGQDEDLSRFDEDDEVKGHEDVVKGVASMVISSGHKDEEMEDV